LAQRAIGPEMAYRKLKSVRVQRFGKAHGIQFGATYVKRVYAKRDADPTPDGHLQ
jgi:hypothetical protein